MKTYRRHDFQPLGSRFLSLIMFIEIYGVINFSSILTTLYPLIMHIFENKEVCIDTGFLQWHKKSKYLKIWF